MNRRVRSNAGLDPTLATMATSRNQGSRSMLRPSATMRCRTRCCGMMPQCAPPAGACLPEAPRPGKTSRRMPPRPSAKTHQFEGGADRSCGATHRGAKLPVPHAPQHRGRTMHRPWPKPHDTQRPRATCAMTHLSHHARSRAFAPLLRGRRHLFIGIANHEAQRSR